MGVTVLGFWYRPHLMTRGWALIVTVTVKDPNHRQEVMKLTRFLLKIWNIGDFGGGLLNFRLRRAFEPLPSIGLSNFKILTLLDIILYHITWYMSHKIKISISNYICLFDSTGRSEWCSFFFFGATLTDLTLASKRPMRSMGPTGAQLFCIESTIPGRTCWYHCWAMAVELGAPLLRETAVIPGFAHYMRLYSLLAKPLFFTHDHKSMLSSNVWCIWSNWYILVTCTLPN